MTNVYALRQMNGNLLFARPKAGGWSVSDRLDGVESRGRNLTVFLEGKDVVGLEAHLPARSETEARRAAPFAIEDEIAQPVENVHVALSARNNGTQNAVRWVNVISSDKMTEIIADLEARGLAEARVIAAHSVLPENNVLWEAPDFVLARLAGRSFSIDASLGAEVLHSILDRQNDVMIFGEKLSASLSRPSHDNGASSKETLLEQLAIWQEQTGNGINLRQGAFAARGQIEFSGLSVWRLAGGLAAALVVSWFAFTLLETRALNERTDNLRSLASEFARTGWPESGGNVENALALTLPSNGSQATAFPSALNASAVLYAALRQVENGELRTLRYDRARGQMTATLAVSSFSDFDRLTNLINENGLQARAGDARQSGDRIVGDVVIGEKL